MTMSSNETIAAIATPPGTGGIGIIRISGPEAENIMKKVFRPSGREIDSYQSHQMVYGRLAEGDETIDECMAVLMRAPRSYTREDVAEIHVHGGYHILNRALSVCLKQGARLAEAGEFTRRAFLNGRIDLSQAEAVMDLISSKGEQERKAAIRQLNGGAASFVRTFSDQLYLLQAGLAACIDYPEEISEEEGANALRDGLESLTRQLEDAIDEHSSRLIHQGLRVALIGRPNVGKSSLLNALLGEERAIVTDVPGTTRDTIQGEMMLNGFRVILTDTAGIHETNDPVEKIGVERSEKTMSEADVSLLLIDASVPMDESDHDLLIRFNRAGAVVLNKSDLPPLITEDDIRSIRPDAELLTVSAMHKDSLKTITGYLSRFVRISDRVTLTQPRHLEAARRAVSHLKDALKTIDTYSPDVCATDLQAAQAALSEITGDNADEKLLDTVFSTFCVGK